MVEPTPMNCVNRRPRRPRRPQTKETPPGYLVDLLHPFGAWVARSRLWDDNLGEWDPDVTDGRSYEPGLLRGQFIDSEDAER